MQSSFQSKQDIYNLFMQAPVGIYLLKGPDYTIEMANEPILKLWGKGPQVIGKPVLESFPEVEEQGYIELLDRVRTTGVPFQTEEIQVWFHNNGQKQQKYVTLLYQPFYENGVVTGIFSIATDVTEKVMTQKRLEQSEQNLRNMILQAPVAICIMLGPDHVIDLANEMMIALWGKSRETVMNKPVFEALPDAREQGLESVMAQVYKTGETFTAYEHPVELLRNGKWETVYQNFVYEPYKDAEGNIQGVLAISVDVTQQVITRRKIEESEVRFRALVTETEKQKRLLEAVTSSTPDLVYIFDLNYHFTYANEALLTMWGKSWDEAIGKGLLENGYEPWQAAMHKREIDEIVATKKSIRGEVSFPHATLGKRVYDYIFAPVINEQGEVEAVAGTTRDITDLKLAEEALRQSEVRLQAKVAERTEELESRVDELKRLNANLEEFAYAASHDLKEPVRKIHFFGDRLKDKLSDKMEAEDFRIFERMQSATKRMGNLIEELLLYSQVTKGIAELEEVDLNKKVHLVMEDLELEIQDKNGQITLESLPHIRGNKRQMQQLFFNLIGNALKYSKQDVPPQIHISSRKVKGMEVRNHLPLGNDEKDYYLIEVKDNGVGFEQKDAERIFNVFTRLYGNAEYRGSGIGLSIVRKVAENHKGWVWAESRPEEGASFKLLLPVDN